jgi:hypothetical protein
VISSGETGSIIGRESFASDAELTKATLHDTLGAVTTESLESVSGKSRTSASTGAKVFLGVLIGAAVVGGVAAIALSAGAAAMPGIIVALEAAGDVVVGTELVDVSMGNAP